MDAETSAVMGATGTIKTLADGTFRVQIDIDPRFAQEAFRLFGAPGTPVALARITSEAAVAHDRMQQSHDAAPPAAAREPEGPQHRGGALAKLAGMLCQQPEFWRFLGSQFEQDAPEDAEQAAALLREVCGIESRAELDHNEEAARFFHENIRIPHLRSQQGVR